MSEDTAEFQRRCERFVHNNVIVNVSGTVRMFAAFGENFDYHEDLLDADSDATICRECRGNWRASERENGEDCEECTEGHSGEVMEYWAIDRHFAIALRKHGESCFDGDVLGLLGCDVWCRTTTGQAISIDHVVETIVREIDAAVGR